MIFPFKWENNTFLVLDQRQLPHEEVYLQMNSLDDCYHHIKDMVVRGAPCIAYVGLYGICAWLKGQNQVTIDALKDSVDYLISSRPTAVNLSFELNKFYHLAQENNDLLNFDSARSYADNIVQLGDEQNRSMAKLASDFICQHITRERYRVITYCNTGRLACGTLGTALGVISYLHQLGKIEMVWVSETRPYLQGARLTAFELGKEGIENRLIVDGASSELMREGKVDFAIVGADRITNYGDTANKIGTSNLAIVSQNYSVPFYVAAPLSSFDFGMDHGEQIQVELRAEEEVLGYQDKRVAPSFTKAWNPSFDITSRQHINAIFSESQIFYPQKNKAFRS